MRTKYKLFLLILIVPLLSFSQSEKINRNIIWTGLEKIQLSENETIMLIRFEGSTNDFADDLLPVFYERIALSKYENFDRLEVVNKIFEPIPYDEVRIIEGSSKISSNIQVESGLAFDRKKPFATLRFIPIQKNALTGFFERLVSFDIEIIFDQDQVIHPGYKSVTYKSNSVLASGNWYKIAVNNTGIYKISYNDLENMGLNVSSINPKNLRVYGNGGGMLPENVNVFRYDDLQENAILVSGEGDGSFDSGDYILFYGESQNEWEYSSVDNRMFNRLNLYSDYNYYYITADMGEGKRIQNQSSTQGLTPTFYSDKFTDAYHYEIEEENLIRSGRIWYGETFDLYNDMEKEINFPNLDLNSQVYLAADVAARSNVNSSFSFLVNGEQVKTFSIPATSSNSITGDYAKTKFDSVSFKVYKENLTVKIVYSKPLASSVGYLNFFTINVVRDLIFSGNQMIFRDTRTAGNSYITEYSLTSGSDVNIWNITDRTNVYRMTTNNTNGKQKFTIESDDLEEFIAFNGSSYYTATLLGKVNNQNLHGLGNYEMIIVTHPDFTEEANRLAEHHINYDGMSVIVVSLPQIYNEFSSGAQDISAIRDFVKMMYDKAPDGNEPKYLLLFGDASFDYKDRIPGNSNYVPTWESHESLNPIGSYIKDDFFGLLDGDEFLDIGIGRFVVSSVSQAEEAVDKTIHYAVNSNEVMGDWRNIICLIADDEDQNLHFNDAEKIAYQIDTSNQDINIDKIYLDAYEQISTPSGERYPKVTQDINTRVDRGALMMNYIGHGGELGLAHERILKIVDINSWKNYDNMPVFITATCEFSRFDDAERTSAGEYVFLNPNGGGIALYTTTRATYANGNLQINKSINKYALNKFNGEYLRMGDVIRLAKNATNPSSENTLKFALLGDPALNFAHPHHNVVTATINNVSIDEPTDTLKALSEVTISGEMQDADGNKLIDFNGTLFPIVFDKPAQYTTQANDPRSNPATFYIQKNALYKGKASVVDGEWSFSFIVPKDIAYNYGYGKLSFYAKTENVDGAGNYMEFIVGGYHNNADSDSQGPVVRLYMNDASFVYGGITDENPSLYATVYDESGINTVGSGIGHDILSTLDETGNYILNDFYEAELDDFQNGTISYPFYNLPTGHHQLSLKVWDVYNNSTTVYTEFVVADSYQMSIDAVMNYPNPFKESTQFSFEHNQTDQPLEVTIRIFNLNGQLVRTLTDQFYAGGYRYNSITWNGDNEGGSKLNQGMYIYKILVRNYDGSVSEETDKLIILR